MSRLLAVLVLSACSAVAAAQQPAPAPAAAPAAGAAALAPHKCEKPDEFPGRLASETQKRNWTRNANGYLECLKKHINEHQASYNAIVDKARPYLDAANASIEEYNKAVASFKAQQGEGN